MVCIKHNAKYIYAAKTRAQYVANTVCLLYLTMHIKLIKCITSKWGTIGRGGGAVASHFKMSSILNNLLFLSPSKCNITQALFSSMLQ